MEFLRKSNKTILNYFLIYMKKFILLLLFFPLLIFSQDNNYSMSFNGISQYVSFDNMNLPTGGNNRTVALQRTNLGAIATATLTSPT